MEVREGGRAVNVAALIAVGVNADGHREFLGAPGCPPARSGRHGTSSPQDGCRHRSVFGKRAPYPDASRAKVGDAVLVRNVLSRFAHRDGAKHAGDTDLTALVEEGTGTLNLGSEGRQQDPDPQG